MHSPQAPSLAYDERALQARPIIDVMGLALAVHRAGRSELHVRAYQLAV